MRKVILLVALLVIVLLMLTGCDIEYEDENFAFLGHEQGHHENFTMEPLDVELCIYEIPDEITVKPGDTWIFRDVDEVSRTATDVIRAKVLDSSVEVIDVSSGEPIPGIDMRMFHHLHTIYSLSVLEVFKGDSEIGSVLDVAHNLQLQTYELAIAPGDELIFFIQRDEMFSHLPMGITGAYQGVFRATLPNLSLMHYASDSFITAYQENVLDESLVLEAFSQENHLILTVGDLVRISDVYGRR